ncbi:hypothetical protein A9Q84_01620 [Halobacteriovorax marinus]|uniref:Lipoprotein n=1 Tax=Halobacteriovorax marinus TaxID=97084 RepID=A0A1Y5FCK2_9BACT|nr:hypothetical protein A9Q84_01620 [Halobacteriovorax marinus]
MEIVKKLPLYLILLSLVGCSTVNMRLSGKKDRRPIEETQKFYLLGLVGEQTLIMKDYCGKGVSHIKEENSFGDSFLTIITLGIYAPRTVQIYCRL